MMYLACVDAGPEINWKPGRSDKIDHAACPEDGRLPDATQGSSHLRNIFNRMGFNDQEIVALSGHSLPHCSWHEGVRLLPALYVQCCSGHLHPQLLLAWCCPFYLLLLLLLLSQCALCIVALLSVQALARISYVQDLSIQCDIMV